MMIKDLGTRVANVWENLRPVTRKMLVGVLQSPNFSPSNSFTPKFSYDAHADWEVSRLLSALDAQAVSSGLPRNSAKLSEINQLAEICVRVLESQSGSAEVFIQLAERAIAKYDYDKLDKLADKLIERFSTFEIAEVVRQTTMPQIRAIAYETLSLLPTAVLAPLLDDPLYADIAATALEQMAFEYGSDEARDLLDQFDSEEDSAAG